jgi:GNAT superfamily N-acetyltransferase
MKHSFRTVDFDRLAEFWNGFYPARYRIDADLLRQHSVESPVFDWGASCVEEADGEILAFVIVKKSPVTLYGGADPDKTHLSAIGYCDAPYGVDLLADVKTLLRNRGVATLVFGQDSRHFFPGCPDDFPTLAGFLMVEGFEEVGLVNDLERDLSDYENKFPAPTGDELRVLEERDIPALEAFLYREFPYRWRYDTMSKVAIEGPSCVFGLFHGDRVDGFAMIQNWTQHTAINGGTWRNDLGDHWGALGAIGVAKALRGHGSGNALLGAALSHLRDLGVRRCIIDWTGLVEFYGKHGFEVSRRYREFALKLRD